MGILELLGLRKPAPAAAPSAAPSASPSASPSSPVRPARSDADGFEFPVDGELVEAHRLLEAFLAEVWAVGRRVDGDVRSTATGRQIREAPPEFQVRILLAAFERAAWHATPEGEAQRRTAVPPLVAGGGLIDDLLLQPLPFTAAQLARLIDWALAGSPYFSSIQRIVSQAWNAAAGPGGRETLRPGLEGVRAWLTDHWCRGAGALPDARVTKMLAEIHVLTGCEGPYLEAEPWTARLSADVGALDDAVRPRWWALLVHLATPAGARPPARWCKEARRLAEAVDRDAFLRRGRAWLAAVPAPTEVAMPAGNADLLRGLVWMLADRGGDDEARALGDLGIALARKIPDVGVRSLKALNACATGLGAMPGTEPVAQLSRLRARVRHAQAQGVIEATLRAAAEARGVGPDELEEMVVPTFGMEEPGLLREEIGGWTAEVRITGTASVETAWVRADGRRQKTAPAELRESARDELAALKKTVGEMTKMLPVQRDRIEALPMTGRATPYGAWRERYLDHPLLALLSRRLIWSFRTGDEVRAGTWHDGVMVDASGAPLDGLGEGTQVSLWHPIQATVDEVRGWRARLEEHGVTQPFKQAHREIYLLTDAERQTGTFSNRFAGHVLRQHQLAALAKERGWQYRLQGHFDGWNPVMVPLPRHGVRAELFVEVAGDRHDVSQHFISLYVTTDQVRFRTPADERWGGEAVELAAVPPLVFSEVMRDVDLFVGVASVGTDPQWGQRDRDAPYGGYWQSFAFGELSPNAVTRAEVLQRLLPRLRIRDACSLDGRFLVVRGSLRTYRIHLGSGNILMEPNDQYLCIVQGPGSSLKERLVLPFEGDATLSLILSKAFLLADDAKITDPVITNQISGHIRPR